MNTQKQIILIVTLFFVFVGSCAAYAVVDLPIRAQDQAEWHHSQSIERGALLFANNCRTCHGNVGEGGVGPAVNGASTRDFQNQDPLILKNNKALLKRTLACGRAGTLMPAWLNTNGGAFNERQIDHLIDLITSPVEEKYKDEEGNPTSEGWFYALEFAHNLNHETAISVGGDTLSTIATAHQLGLAEISAANGNRDPYAVIERGDKIKLPATKAHPEGRTYLIRQDNETLAKIAESQSVGALILAELNGLPYKFDEKAAKITLLNAEGQEIPGLFPGDTLKLPDNTRYVVKTGDTIESIATAHGLRPADVSGNGNNAKLLGTTDQTKALEGERKLKVPSVYVVQPGDAVATIASQHGIPAADFQGLNGLTAETVPGAGQELKLPADARYTVQPGDTLASIAEHHKTTAAELAKLNEISESDAVTPQVVITLPKVDKYVVKGQNLDDIAKTLSNVTAAELGEANGVPATAVLRIGQALVLPDTAQGSAPPDARNPGTACVEHAVPDAVFKTLPGVGTPEPVATPPAEQAKDVTITSGANDFTVTADGTKSEMNKGVVSIAKGTAVKFVNQVGIHTITVNGTKDNGDLKGTDTRTLTFANAGTFKITCDYHPAMLATIFVQ